MGPPSKRPELREMTGCRYQRLYFGTSTLLRAGDGPADQEKVRRRWHWSTDERRQGCHTERPKNNKLVRWGTLWEPPPLPIFPRHVRRQSGREGFALATPGSNCWCGSHGGRLAGKPYCLDQQQAQHSSTHGVAQRSNSTKTINDEEVVREMMP